MTASVPPRPPNHPRKRRPCSGPTGGCASRPRDDRAAQAVPNLPGKLCDSNAPLPPRCKPRFRYVEALLSVLLLCRRLPYLVEHLIQDSAGVIFSSHHYGKNPASVADVLDRICIQQHQIGYVTRLDYSVLVRLEQKYRWVDCSCLQRLQRRKPALYQPPQFVMQAESGKYIRVRPISPGQELYSRLVHGVNQLEVTSRFRPRSGQLLRWRLFEQLLRCPLLLHRSG